MTVKVRIEGFADLDAALAEFRRSTAASVLKRAGTRAIAPMAETARRLAPVDDGELRDSITVSAKAKGTGVRAIGNAAFAAVLRGGGSREEARTALRSAQRGAQAEKTFVELFMGPTEAKTKANAIKRIVQEFGSRHQPPQAYMRPAWDAEKHATLDRTRTELAAEIQKTAARIRARAARAAARAAAGR